MGSAERLKERDALVDWRSRRLVTTRIHVIDTDHPRRFRFLRLSRLPFTSLFSPKAHVLRGYESCC